VYDRRGGGGEIPAELRPCEGVSLRCLWEDPEGGVLGRVGLTSDLVDISALLALQHGETRRLSNFRMSA
jgi:hypothetical protein